MSDKSPEETPEENPLDDATLDAPDEETIDEEFVEESAEDDDEVIARLEADLPADDTALAAAPIRRRTAQAPVKKAAPTRKRSETEREAVDPYKAKNPAQFARQSVGELKQVVWPSWNTLIRYFWAVLLFVLFVLAVVSLLDWAFGWALLQILGN